MLGIVRLSCFENLLCQVEIFELLDFLGIDDKLKVTIHPKWRENLPSRLRRVHKGVVSRPTAVTLLLL